MSTFTSSFKLLLFEKTAFDSLANRLRSTQFGKQTNLLVVSLKQDHPLVFLSERIQYDRTVFLPLRFLQFTFLFGFTSMSVNTRRSAPMVIDRVLSYLNCAKSCSLFFELF